MSVPDGLGVLQWEEAILQRLDGMSGGDSAHDRGHLLRVLSASRRIAAAEGGHDELVLTAAALLHDCVALRKDDPRRSEASRLAAAEAARVLAAMGFPQDRLDGVRHAIEAHSFSAGIAPQTPEARAIQDADRIDALGAIGIARCFAVSGALGRALFDPADPLADHRPLDEATWALDHFQTKLLRLPQTMQTAAGRALAGERARFLEAFMSRLAAESCGLDGIDG